MQGTLFKHPDEKDIRLLSFTSGHYQKFIETAIRYEHFKADLQTQGTSFKTSAVMLPIIGALTAGFIKAIELLP